VIEGLWRVLLVVGASAPLFLPVLARRSTHLRLEMCPKCKQKFYDLTNGRCYACGFKGWGFFRPEEDSRRVSRRFETIIKLLLVAFILLVILLLVGVLLGMGKIPFEAG